MGDESRKRLKRSGKPIPTLLVKEKLQDFIKQSLENKNHNHNLNSDDLQHLADIINTSAEITLSGKKHQNAAVLEFIKDIKGEIKVLTEVHAKKGYLLVFNAWRKNKARERPDATSKSPPELTSKTLSPNAHDITIADMPLSVNRED